MKTSEEPGIPPLTLDRETAIVGIVGWLFAVAIMAGMMWVTAFDVGWMDRLGWYYLAALVVSPAVAVLLRIARKRGPGPNPGMAMGTPVGAAICLQVFMPDTGKFFLGAVFLPFFIGTWLEFVALVVQQRRALTHRRS